MDLRTAHALVRFGMGPSGAEPPPADPAAWLLSQLRHADFSPDFPGVAPASSAEGLAALRADREARRTAREADPAMAAINQAPVQEAGSGTPIR